MMENTRRGPLIPASLMHNRIVNAVLDGSLMLAALLIVAFRWEVVGSLVFLGVIGVMLIGSDRLSDCWVPLILMTVILTRCYDSYDTFVRFAPYIGVVVATVFFHVAYYWAKPTFGPSFPGLCAVAVAVTFGGAFFISAADYFRPIMLYYVGGLGVLMPLLYVTAKPRVDDEARERFLRGLFLAGCLSIFSIATFYHDEWQVFIETLRAPCFQSANNLATFLMLAMPTGFFLSAKNRLFILSPIVMYAAILLCNSRGGSLLGTVEFFLLLLFFCFYRADWFRRIVYISYAAVVIALFIVFLPKIVVFVKLNEQIDGYTDMKTFELLRMLFIQIIASNKTRMDLLARALDDFRANPLFGTGLGYRGNSDIYDPVRGAMNWYHMWLPQIVGSLGILGILCYGYQLFGRIRLAFSRRALPEVTLSLCYLGLFLMSQVNPGEFCPFPYAITATLIFVLIEPSEPPLDSIPAPHKQPPLDPQPPSAL